MYLKLLKFDYRTLQHSWGIVSTTPTPLFLLTGFAKVL